jgi:hypothetical protein
MLNSSKRVFFAILFSLLAFTLSGLNTVAQTPRSSAVRDVYLISAEAGGVNYVEGDVTVVAAGNASAISKGERLNAGDMVRTGGNGRAELLLNPGSYLRLAGNSEARLDTTSLDDLKISVTRGIAIFEVLATDKFRVDVRTPAGKVFLVESGVYRITVDDQASTVAVVEGKAVTGMPVPVMVTKGKLVPIGSVAVSKFDRKKGDGFDEWSRSRGKELAKMASTLKNKNVKDHLLLGFAAGAWNMRSSFGLWVFDSMRGFCFLPFGSGWNSPYGFGYGGNIHWYGLPSHFYPPVSPANDIARRRGWTDEPQLPPGRGDSGGYKPPSGDSGSRVVPPVQSSPPPSIPVTPRIVTAKEPIID